MEDTLVQMVLIRQRILDTQAAIKQHRDVLKSLTEQVQQYMTESNVKTITNVAGEYTVSLATSQRMPPLSMEFVQDCLLRYLTQAGDRANAVDASNFVFEQRKEQKQLVTRVQVRRAKNGNGISSNSTQLITPDQTQQVDESDNSDEEPNAFAM